METRRSIGRRTNDRACWLLRRVAQVGLVLTLLSEALVSPTVAYNNYDSECWWWNPSGQYLYVYWKWGPNIDTHGGWAIDFSAAATSWSNAGTKVRMVYSSSAVDTADTYYAVESKPGYTHYWCNWWNYTMADAHAYGNLYVYPNSGTSDYRKATASHEQGHTLGLGHSSDSYSVMYKFQNLGFYLPTYDDVAGLNTMYPWYP